MNRKLLLIAMLALPARAFAQESAEVSLDSLRALSVWEAEQGFARTAAELGTREAFLAHLAEESVVFTPRARDGIEAYRALEESNEVLQWEPAFAESSSADDLGYTTGPYIYRAGPAEPVTGRGLYFTIWQRNADGVWKVVLDLGTAADAEPAATRRIEIPQRSAAPAADAALRRSNLLRLEQLLADAAAARSAQRALRQALDVDVRHNNGGTIVRGGRAVAASVPDSAVAYVQQGAGFSRDADMAYTFGEYTHGKRASETEPDGNWVRIWRVQGNGEWNIVHLVTAPFASSR